MALPEAARPAAEQGTWNEPAAAAPLIRPIPTYPSSPAGVDSDAGAAGLAAGRRRLAIARLQTRPCVLRCAGALGEVFWV